MNTTKSSQLTQDKAKIRELTEQWRILWSPQAKPFTGKDFENIFAIGENEILVFDNFDNSVVVLRSLQEYLATWIPVMQNFSYWEIQLENNLTIFDYMSFDHVMICVPNYAETLEWYREKLDATIEKEWLVDELPDLKLAYLNIHGFRLEVVGSTQAQKGMPVASNFGESLRTTGIGHFCFRVDDVDAALAEMNRRGVPTFVEAADYPHVKRRVGFVQDNNGNIVEFAGSLKGI